MNTSKRILKKGIVLSAFVILILIILISEDIFLKLIAAALILSFAGLLIFLRNDINKSFSKNANRNYSAEFKQNNKEEKESGKESKAQSSEEIAAEEIKIISGNPNVEVITSEEYKNKVKAASSAKQTNGGYYSKENYEKIVNEQIPKDIGSDGQFLFILERLLIIIKESLNAYSAIFFWYNSQKRKIIVEKFASNSNAIELKKFDLEDDVLSKIVLTEEPRYLNDIKPAAEKDALIYYSQSQGIRSFLGMPLIYGKNVAGILAIDSKSPDAFGEETIYLLGRYNRLISILITIFEERHKESISQKRLNGLLSIISNENIYKSEADFYDSIVKSLNLCVNYDAFAFVEYDYIKKRYFVSKTFVNGAIPYIAEQSIIDVNESLVGKCIQTGLPVKLNDASIERNVKFFVGESIGYDGSFLAIPIVYDDVTLGAFCFENLRKYFYSNSDVNFFKSALKFYGMIIKHFLTLREYKTLVNIDYETGLLNQRSFEEYLENEIYKLKISNVPCSLALIYIDEFLEQETIFDANPFSKVLKNIVEVVRTEIPKGSASGRLSKRELCVYLYNFSLKDAFIWAEKLRVKIARKPITALSKQTTFTVSIGLSFVNDSENYYEAIETARLALKKAVEKGGNVVFK